MSSKTRPGGQCIVKGLSETFNVQQNIKCILMTEDHLFSEHLKDFKQMFDLVLEGEKHVDQAKTNLVGNLTNLVC